MYWNSWKDLYNVSNNPLDYDWSETQEDLHNEKSVHCFLFESKLHVDAIPKVVRQLVP